MEKMQGLLSVDEAAEFLGISRVTLANLIVKKEIPATKLAGRWVMDKEKLEKFIKDKMDSNLLESK